MAGEKETQQQLSKTFEILEKKFNFEGKRKRRKELSRKYMKYKMMEMLEDWNEEEEVKAGETKRKNVQKKNKKKGKQRKKKERK